MGIIIGVIVASLLLPIALAVVLNFAHSVLKAMFRY